MAKITLYSKFVTMGKMFYFLTMLLICVMGSAPQNVLETSPTNVLDIMKNATEKFSVKQYKDCETYLSCANRKPLERDTLKARAYMRYYNCYCDDLCELFNDCCFDHTSANVTQELFFVSSKYHKCLTLPEISTHSYLTMVAQCPVDYTAMDIKEACESTTEDQFLKLPVSGVRSRVTYKNRYCALCHGEESLYWKVQVKCRELHSLNSTQRESWNNDSQNCYTNFEPPAGFTDRKCRPSTVTCAPGLEETNDAKWCEKEPASYMYTSTDLYKNVYCALCNNVTEEDLTCRSRGRIGGTIHTRKFYSFARLMDINSGTSTNVRSRGRHTAVQLSETRVACAKDEVFDPFLSTCRKLWCNTESGFRIGSCEKTMEEIRDCPDCASLPDCTWTRLNGSEYSIDTRNGDLVVMNRNVIYNRTAYHMEHGFVFVCDEFAQNDTGTSESEQFGIGEFSDIQAIVSTIGLILSLVALCILLMVYSLLQSLRNTPGKILMNLACALFLAELFFLIAPSLEYSRIACIVIAIIMQLMFLAAFFWMNVMSFDIWYTFSKQAVRAPSGKTKRYWQYIGYAWGIPALITAIGVIVDFTDTNFPLKPGYGLRSCWFNNRFGLMLFFAGPLSLVMVINIICYITTIRNITLIDKSTKVVQKQSDKRRFSLYIKLCFIMGTTWIFGFVATFTNLEFIWYLFIIFNTLQGVFICVAFVCTGKVFRLLKEKLRCKKCMGRRLISSELSSSKSTLATRPTYVVSDSAN